MDTTKILENYRLDLGIMFLPIKIIFSLKLQSFNIIPKFVG